MSAHYSLPWHGTHIYGATGCTSDTRRLPALFKKIARLKKPEANCVLASLKRIWAAVKANTKSHVGCCASRGCNLSGFPAFYSVAQAIILPNTRKLLATVKHRNAKVRGCGVTKFEDWLSFPEHISTKRKVSFTTSHCYKTVLSKKKKKKGRWNKKIHKGASKHCKFWFYCCTFQPKSRYSHNDCRAMLQVKP